MVIIMALVVLLLLLVASCQSWRHWQLQRPSEAVPARRLHFFFLQVSARRRCARCVTARRARSGAGHAGLTAQSQSQSSESTCDMPRPLTATPGPGIDLQKHFCLPTFLYVCIPGYPLARPQPQLQAAVLAAWHAYAYARRRHAVRRAQARPSRISRSCGRGRSLRYSSSPRVQNIDTDRVSRYRYHNNIDTRVS